MQLDNKVLIILAVFAGLLVMCCGGAGVFMLFGLTARTTMPASVPARMVSVAASSGSIDYEWSAVALDGSEAAMGQYEGQPALFNVWATWCPPCRAEMPSIQRLYEEVGDEGIAVVTLSVDESADEVREYLDKNGFDMPSFMLGSAYPDALETNSIPLTIIVAGDGSVRMRHVGSNEWDSDEVVELLRSLKE